MESGTTCTLPLWLDRSAAVAPVPGRPGLEGLAILAAAADWLDRTLGPWLLLAVGFGAALALVGRRGLW